MASSNATFTGVAPFRFTNLPTELRIKIYELCFKAPKEVTLRLPAELVEAQNDPQRRVRPPLPIKDTSILRVSRGVDDEATSVFYANNRFHYTTQETITCWPPRFSAHVLMMRHVSLEYHDESFGAEHSQQASALLDTTTIGCLVTQLMQHAAQLRTFSLYITATPRYGVAGSVTLNDADALTLRTLRARLN